MGILRTDKISGLETPTPVTGSVLFDGTGDYLSIASVPELQLGTTNFTIEAWINLGTASGSHQQIVAAGNPESANSFVIQVREDGSDRLLDFRTDARSDTSTSSIPTNEWTHIAVTKESNVVKLFINGVLENSGTEAESLTTAITAIGYRSASSYGYVNGYISNLRILKGTALYTSDFTVPVHALEVIGDTVLLCCNNPDSVTAASNAGIGAALNLTANGDPTVSTVSPALTRDFTDGTEFRGVTTFDTQGYFVPPSGTTTQRGSGRGIVGGVANAIHYIQIHTSGNSQDFGDLTYSPNGYTTSYGSSTRGLIAGGYNPHSNAIDYITIASTGDAKEFGDISLTNGVYSMGPAGSNTRGLFGGGHQEPGSPNAIAAQAQINYVTMQTLGNSQDFGDLVQGVRYPAGFGSPTRAIFAGGRTNDPAPATNKNVIQYVTIATLGNAQDFGDLTYSGSGGVYSCRAVYSSTRGVVGGGVISPAYINAMDYVTITSLGNSQEFGDLPGTGSHIATMSSKDRGVFAGGYAPAATNVMSFITITSTGDAKDFGDLYSSMAAPSGMSDSHGGIS